MKTKQPSEKQIKEAVKELSFKVYSVSDIDGPIDLFKTRASATKAMRSLIDGAGYRRWELWVDPWSVKP